MMNTLMNTQFMGDNIYQRRIINLNVGLSNIVHFVLCIIQANQRQKNDKTPINTEFVQRKGQIYVLEAPLGRND